MSSILSALSDGLGYHYGWRGDDPRQINARRQRNAPREELVWFAWVGGERITHAGRSHWLTLPEAEAAALAWMDANPLRRSET